ncbi:MAG: hypothetical protein ACTSUN_00020 [Promethearchaeota archaeon]
MEKKVIKSIEKYMRTDFYSEEKPNLSNKISNYGFLERSEPGEIEIEDERKMRYLFKKYSYKPK